MRNTSEQKVSFLVPAKHIVLQIINTTFVTEYHNAKWVGYASPDFVGSEMLFYPLSVDAGRGSFF